MTIDSVLLGSLIFVALFGVIRLERNEKRNVAKIQKLEEEIASLKALFQEMERN